METIIFIGNIAMLASVSYLLWLWHKSENETTN